MVESFECCRAMSRLAWLAAEVCGGVAFEWSACWF